MSEQRDSHPTDSLRDTTPNNNSGEHASAQPPHEESAVGEEDAARRREEDADAIMIVVQAQLRAATAASIAAARRRLPTTEDPHGAVGESPPRAPGALDDPPPRTVNHHGQRPPRPPRGGPNQWQRPELRRKPLKQLLTEGPGSAADGDHDAATPVAPSPRLLTIPIASTADIAWRCPLLGVLGSRSGASWLPCDAVRENVAHERHHWIAHLPAPPAMAQMAATADPRAGGSPPRTQRSKRQKNRSGNGTSSAPSTARPVTRPPAAPEEGVDWAPSGRDVDGSAAAASPPTKERGQPKKPALLLAPLKPTPKEQRNPYYKAYMHNLVVLLGTYDSSSIPEGHAAFGATEKREEPTPIPVPLSPLSPDGGAGHGAAFSLSRSRTLERAIRSTKLAEVRAEKEKWREKLRQLTMSDEEAQKEVKRKQALAARLAGLFRAHPSDSADEGGLLDGDD